MGMKKVIMLLVVMMINVVVVVNAATYTFTYSTSSAGSFDFNSASTWQENGVPGVGDDVYITGSVYYASPAQTITLSSDKAVKSIHIDAYDVTFVLNAALTVETITCNTCNIDSTSSSGLLIITKVGNWTENEHDNVLKYVTVNVTQTAEVTVTSGMTNVTATVNNMGKWTWAFSDVWGEGDQMASFNNYGTMTALNDARVVAAITNYQSGTFYIPTGAVFTCSVITGNYDPDSSFTNYGSLIINGRFEVGTPCPWTFASGTLTGTGVLYSLGYTSFAPVQMKWLVDVDTTVQYSVESYVQVDGPGNLRFQSFVSTPGLVLSGTGTLRVVRWNNIGASHQLGTGSGRFINRNITIEKNWNFYAGPGFNLSNSYVISLPGSTCQLFSGIGFTGDANSGVINYGNITSQQGLAYFRSDAPLYNYGFISIPDKPISGGSLISQYWENGGVLNGYFHAQDTGFDAGTPGRFGESAWGFTAGTGYIVGPSANFDGGFFVFNGKCSYADQDDACLAAGSYYFYGLKGGSILSHAGSALRMMVPNVVIPRYIALAGNIYGPNNLTVTDGLRADNGYGLQWKIDGTSVIITKSWDFTNIGSVSFLNGGKFIIQKGATLKAQANIGGSTDESAGVGIYHYGSGFFTYEQGFGIATLSVPFFNFGSITVATTITNTKGDGKGVEMRLYYFKNYGTLNINIYSETDYDVLDYYIGDGCMYGGNLNIVFKYTPAIGSSYTIIDGPSSTFCSGHFNVTLQNAPANTIGVIFYDQPNYPYANTVAILSVCSSSNTTCTSYVPPVHGTTSSTGASTTTGAPSTTTGSPSTTSSTTRSGTSSPSPSSSSSSRTSSTTGEVTDGAMAVVVSGMAIVCCILASIL